MTSDGAGSRRARRRLLRRRRPNLRRGCGRVNPPQRPAVSRIRLFDLHATMATRSPARSQFADVDVAAHRHDVPSTSPDPASPPGDDAPVRSPAPMTTSWPNVKRSVAFTVGVASSPRLRVERAGRATVRHRRSPGPCPRPARAVAQWRRRASAPVSHDRASVAQYGVQDTLSGFAYLTVTRGPFSGSVETRRARLRPRRGKRPTIGVS